MLVDASFEVTRRSGAADDFDPGEAFLNDQPECSQMT